MEETIEQKVEVPVCIQCHSVKRRGEWYQVGYQVVQEIKEKVPLREEYCSHKCLVDYIVGAD